MDAVGGTTSGEPGKGQPEPGAGPSDAPVPTLRERQAERVRHEIRSQFVRLVVERGAHGFTFHDLASESGVSIRTLYRYYPNREAIIDSIKELEIHALDQEILRNAGSLTNFDSDPDLVASLFEVLDSHAVLMQAGRALGVTGYDGRTSAERTEMVRHVIAETEGISPPAAHQLAGVVRLLLGSEAWARLREGDIELDAREAGYAVHWAVQNLMAAAVGIDGPLRPRVAPTEEPGDAS